MKKTLLSLIIIAATALMFACNSNNSSGELSLNNGEKWVVNTEMKPHIEKGNKILNKYIATQREDHLQLAKALEEQNTALIQSCTMDGEAHEELHKWLHPHIKLITELSEAGNQEEAKAIVSKLEASFETYHNHFQ